MTLYLLTVVETHDMTSLCGLSIQALLALATRLTGAVMMRASLPVSAALEERVDHSMVGGTQHDRATVVRERGAAVGERINMMDV